jgi:hypothetical protein
LLKYDIGLSSSCRMTITRQGDDAPRRTARPSHLTQPSGVLRHPTRDPRAPSWSTTRA